MHEDSHLEMEYEDRFRSDEYDEGLEAEQERPFAPESVPILFNMDLANGPTSERFCREAAAVLGKEISDDDKADLDSPTPEYVSEMVQEWTDALDEAGFYVRWDAGDVVVWDLRGLSDDDREAFYDAMS